MAITCQFNRFGTLLAVGCNDGRIVVWDFLTRGIAKIIQAHVHPVCSISWSRSGQRMVSASTDNTVSVWDILTGESDQRFRFPSPVLKVQFHPRCETEILVTPMRHAAVVVTISEQPTSSSATASSMTTLLTHTVAHSTKPSFRPKTNNQPIKNFLSLALS